MGIQSTKYITREDAINRIAYIASLLITKNYEELKSSSFEDGDGCYSLSDFVENWEPSDVENLENWTDEMLEDYMDNPFFRYSMFDNYLIDGEDDD